MADSKFFEGHNVEKLKSWCHNYLEARTDADTDTLSSYIIGLLNIQRDSRNIDKEKLISELEEFLEDETQPFVELLATVLRDKSYMDGAAAAAPSEAAAAPSSSDSRHQRNFSSTRSPQRDSGRQRGVDDSRTAGRDRFDDRDRRGHKRRRSLSPPPPPHNSFISHPYGASQQPLIMTTSHGRDASYSSFPPPPPPYAAAHGRPMPPLHFSHNPSQSAENHSGYPHAHPGDQRVERGYHQGEGGDFKRRRFEEHPRDGFRGGDRVPRGGGPRRFGDRDGRYVDRDDSRSYNGDDNRGRRFSERPPPGRVDRHVSGSASVGDDNDAIVLIDTSGSSQVPGSVSADGQGRGADEEMPYEVVLTTKLPKEPPPTAEEKDRFTKLNEEMRESNNTIAVAPIPPESNTYDALRQHFSQFGNIINISCKKYQKKAFIQFEQHEEAFRAINSPEAVFGNRFIKVFFPKKQAQQALDSGAAPTTLEEEEQAPKPFVQPGAAPGFNTYVNPALAQQRAEQVQQLQVQQQQLVQKEQTLLDEYMNLRKTMFDRLLKEEDAEKKKKLLQTVKDLDQRIEKQLQKVKEETAASASTSTAMASDPMMMEDSFQAPPFPVRGRGRGRGGMFAPARGAWHGAPAPAFRGRGGRGAGMAWNQRSGMSLDNRSSTLVVLDIPESKRDKDILQQHFARFGEISSLEFAPGEDKATVSFENRKSAENAFATGKTLDDASLRIRWQSGQPAGGVAASSSTSPTGAESDFSNPTTAATPEDHTAAAQEEDIYAYEDEDDSESWNR